MLKVLPELLIAPLLVGGSTVACRRWGERIGGLLSAFPAVVGPVLLILALERGPAFTARAADGTLLGLAALAGFVLTYSRTARRTAWGQSLAVAWACTGAIAASIYEWGQSLAFPDGLVAAAISLVVARRLIPSWRLSRHTAADGGDGCAGGRAHGSKRATGTAYRWRTGRASHPRLGAGDIHAPRPRTVGDYRSAARNADGNSLLRGVLRGHRPDGRARRECRSRSRRQPLWQWRCRPRRSSCLIPREPAVPVALCDRDSRLVKDREVDRVCDEAELVGAGVQLPGGLRHRFVGHNHARP